MDEREVDRMKDERMVRQGGDDIPWRVVLLLVAVMLVVGITTALLSTHKHIQGEVVDVGESDEVGWSYFIIYGDASEFVVYNIFPNSEDYDYDVGDHFDEWVPNGLWVEH
jgi:hypothetical protein